MRWRLALAGPPLPGLLVAALVSGCSLLGTGCQHGAQIEALGAQVAALEEEAAERDASLVRLEERLAETAASLAEARRQLEELEEEGEEVEEALATWSSEILRLARAARDGDRARSTWRSHSESRLSTVEQRLGLEPPPVPDTEPDPEPADPLPQDPAVQVLMARDHLDRGETEAARAHLEQALEAEDAESTAEMRYLLGLTWFEEERWGQAATVFQSTSESHPGTEWAARALLRQGECLQAMGEYDTTRILLEEVVERFPGSEPAAEAKRLLADLL